MNGNTDGRKALKVLIGDVPLPLPPPQRKSFDH
jgi:hypothetical protein